MTRHLHLKEDLSDWLQVGDFARISQCAAEQKRVLSVLTGLTYHPDPLIAWRAVQGLGIAARQIAGRDPEYVRIHLRRFIWLVNDESGGIGWRAPEAIGEVITQCPGQFDEFIPPLFHLLDLEEEDAPRFRAGVLWAIGRVSTVRPGAVLQVLDLVSACLADPDPQVRGLALWALAKSRQTVSVDVLEKLSQDHSPVWIYQDGTLIYFSVAELAALAAQSG